VRRDADLARLITASARPPAETPRSPALERIHPRLRVSFTLPVLPGGRSTDGIAAAQSVLRQLQHLYPHSGAAALRRRIGITPMIGINDVGTERL
jgi:hypothetical protein